MSDHENVKRGPLNPRALSKQLLNHYQALPLSDKKVLATYVWIDGTGEHVRSKTKTLDKVPKVPSDCPVWNFDGSSTLQSEGKNSDVFLIPVALYRDPFKGGNHRLVLCETFSHDHSPHPSNTRRQLADVLEKCGDAHKPWFGVEQEYTIIDLDGKPFGWPKEGYPEEQGAYYCGAGATRAVGRSISDSHYKACLYAGVAVYGTNGEVMPSQWEFQVGTGEGISCADDLWMARFILHRVAEDYGLDVSFDPKPVEGDWNGSGAHTNVSILSMREDGGIKEIEKAIKKLEKRHQKHVEMYDPKQGKDNQRRLTGLHETSRLDEFTWGVADRGASIRIPRQVAEDGKGYFEDRRPSSNCDPYVVSRAILETICLDM